MVVRHRPLLLFLLALAIRLLVIAFTRFDGLYGQDAFAYFEYARQIFVTPFGAPLPGPLYWPLGYPALASLFFHFTGLNPFGAQMASIIAGAGVAPVVYLIAIEIRGTQRIGENEGDWGAVAAGIIAAGSGQLLQSSIVIMADAAGVFWATLAVYALLRAARRKPVGALSISAAALALAIVTRWIFAALIIPFAVYLLISRRAVVYRASSLAAPVGIFLLITLPQIYFSQVSAAPVLGHGWVINWNPLNAVRSSFDNPDGHFDYRWPPILFYAEPFFHPFYLFPLLTPFVVAGAWRLRRSPALSLIGGWAAVTYLYLIGIPYENFRFGLAYFPAVAMLAGAGLVHQRMERIQRMFICSLFIVSWFISTPFVYRGLSSFLDVKAREAAATRYLESQVPAGATVITFGLTLTLGYYTDFETVELSEQTPDSLAVIVCGGSPVFTFVERENIESQWVGKAPAANFLWLGNEAGMDKLGKEGTWSLYRAECGRG